MAWKSLSNQERFPFWKPKVNDILEGVLTQKIAESGRFKTPAFIIKDNQGQSFEVSGAVLERHLSDMAIGTQVKIAYTGLVQGKNGQYKNFMINFWEEDDSQEVKADEIPF